MSVSSLHWFIHIGPVRKESENLLKNIKSSGLIITPPTDTKKINDPTSGLILESAWIGIKAGEATLYNYNLTEFDSLVPATGLQSLYPGLRQISVQDSVDTQSLTALMSVHGVPSSHLKRLVIEQPEQAIALLKAWEEEGLLESLEELFVRTSPISLYKGMPTQADLLTWCEQHGFEKSIEAAGSYISEDPEFTLLSFKRNSLYDSLKASKAQVENLKKKNELVEKELSEKNTIIARLSEQLAIQRQSQEITSIRFEEMESRLEGKLESFFNKQYNHIQQTTNALGQHVTRSSRLQRDELALTHYLQHGQRIIQEGVDSRYALALLEQYNSQRYDVVIVFGSASTTELLARAEVSAHGRQTQLMLKSQTNEVVSPSENDLPTSIISIEHQKKVCTALTESLDASNCRQAVNVVYAPWVESDYQGKTTLFYSAEATLKRLGQWLPDDANVLIIFGSALANANNGVYPELSHLLQYLPTQTLEILMEDLEVKLEDKLKDNWSTLLDSRQREAQWHSLVGTLGLKVFS